MINKNSPPPITRSLSASCNHKRSCGHVGLSFLGFAAIPAVLCFTFICCFGVNVLVGDDWVMAILAEDINDSGWSFADLFVGHGEHRIFFPRLLYLAVAYLSNFNSVVQMLTSFVMLSLIVFVIGNYIIQRKDVSDKKKYFLVTIVSFLVYSWIQWQNLLWGFQVGFFMLLLFQILSYYFLYLMFHAKNKLRVNLYFAASLFAAFIASFSSAQGVISWIVGAILMLIMFRKKTFTSPYFIAWLIIGLFVWIAYLYNLSGAINHSVGLAFLDNPLKSVMFFFRLIGNSMLPQAFGYLLNMEGVFIVGLIFIVCIVLWQSKTNNLQEFVFPIALILNGLFVTGSIAFGRIHLASRYTSFSIYIIVGLLLILVELRDKNGKSIIKNLTSIFVIMVILSIPITMANGLYRGIVNKADQNYYRYMMETFNIKQDEQNPNSILPLYYFEEEKALQCINFLKEHRYNVFHTPLYEVSSILYDDNFGQANNDALQLAPNTFQFTPNNITITPTVTSDYKDKITNLYLDIDGNIYPLYENKHKFNPFIQWLTQFDRIRHVSGTGTSFISLRSLTPGIHRVKIKALTADGTYFYIVDPDITFESK